MKTLKAIREWYGGYPEKVDPWALPVMRFINRLPGCATVMCCAGAGPAGYDKRKRHFGYETPFIHMVCCNPQSMFVLMKAAESVSGTTFYTLCDNNIKEPIIRFRFKSFEALKKFGGGLRQLVRNIRQLHHTMEL